MALQNSRGRVPKITRGDTSLKKKKRSQRHPGRFVSLPKGHRQGPFCDSAADQEVEKANETALMSGDKDLKKTPFREKEVVCAG